MAKRLLLAMYMMALVASATAVHEFVGMAPAGGASSPDNAASARFGGLRGRRRLQPGMADPLIKWAELRYYANATSADDVSIKAVTATNKHLGKWFDLSLKVRTGAVVVVVLLLLLPALTCFT